MVEGGRAGSRFGVGPDTARFTGQHGGGACLGKPVRVGVGETRMVVANGYGEAAFVWVGMENQ